MSAFQEALRDDAAPLRGSLGEMSLGELLSLPEPQARSGALVVRTAATEAWLYYRRGQLVRAECEGLRGEAALTRLAAAARPGATGEGGYEFHPNVSCTQRGRDPELAAAAARLMGRGTERPAAAQVEQLVAAPVHAVWLLGADGQMLASAGRFGSETATTELREHLLWIVGGHPTGRLRQAVLEDDWGVMALAPAGNDVLVLLLDPGTSPLRTAEALQRALQTLGT